VCTPAASTNPSNCPPAQAAALESLHHDDTRVTQSRPEVHSTKREPPYPQQHPLPPPPTRTDHSRHSMQTVCPFVHCRVTYKGIMQTLLQEGLVHGDTTHQGFAQLDRREHIRIDKESFCRVLPPFLV
jgi:hypothetical protein